MLALYGHAWKDTLTHLCKCTVHTHKINNTHTPPKKKKEKRKKRVPERIHRFWRKITFQNQEVLFGQS